MNAIEREMRRRHVTRLYEERAAELEWRWWAGTLARMFGAVCLGALLVLAAAAVSSGNGCGDTAFGDEREGGERVGRPDGHAGHAPDGPGMPAQRQLPALALSRRLRAWQPLVRVSDDQLRVVSSAIVEATSDAPWPSPWLVSAVAFRESAFRTAAIGARGEIGLMQVHGLALQGASRADALVPATNVRLGVLWLRRAREVCERAGWTRDLEVRALSRYAGLGCQSSAGARRALRWAVELQDAGGRS